MFSLKNKTAVVTGGGSGIGKATALLFAAQGANVHILDLNESEAGATAKEITNLNGIAVVHQCDVSVQEKVKQVFNDIGVVDILVNSAGISHIGTAENTSEQDFDRLYNVNVKGVYNCLHEALPGMKKKGSGVILNMASVANNMGLPDRFAYSMTKGAVYTICL